MPTQYWQNSRLPADGHNISLTRLLPWIIPRCSHLRTCLCANTQGANAADIWKAILDLIYMCMCRKAKGHLQHLEHRTWCKTLNVHSSTLPLYLCDQAHICTHFTPTHNGFLSTSRPFAVFLPFSGLCPAVSRLSACSVAGQTAPPPPNSEICL